MRTIISNGMQTSHYYNKYTLGASPIVIPYESFPTNIITPNYTSWKSRDIHVFYMTRQSLSYNCNKIDKMHGACKNSKHSFRHTPLHVDSYKHSIIGHELEYNVWKRSWSNSRFCLSLRGDDPLSHAVSRAGSQGCIPVGRIRIYGWDALSKYSI